MAFWDFSCLSLKIISNERKADLEIPCGVFPVGKSSKHQFAASFPSMKSLSTNLRVPSQMGLVSFVVCSLYSSLTFRGLGGWVCIKTYNWLFVWQFEFWSHPFIYMFFLNKKPKVLVLNVSQFLTSFSTKSKSFLFLYKQIIIKYCHMMMHTKLVIYTLLKLRTREQMGVKLY